MKKDCKKNSRESFSKKEKEEKWQYGWEQYKHLSEAEKQKLVEYWKNDIKCEKNTLL